MMESFCNKFPKIAKKETRSITIFKKGSFNSLPTDNYTFLRDEGVASKL
jgi:hypothetical protein